DGDPLAVVAQPAGERVEPCLRCAHLRRVVVREDRDVRQGRAYTSSRRWRSWAQLRSLPAVATRSRRPSSSCALSASLTAEATAEGSAGSTTHPTPRSPTSRLSSGRSLTTTGTPAAMYSNTLFGRASRWF